MVGQGLAYSAFAAVLWPSVPLVVEAKYIGLGYGLITSVQNGGLSLFPVIVAKIASDNNGKYIPSVEVFFISLSVIAFVIGLFLNYHDYYHHDSILNKPTNVPDEKGDKGEGSNNLTVGGKSLVSNSGNKSKSIAMVPPVSPTGATVNAMHEDL